MARKSNCHKSGSAYYRITETVGIKADGTTIRKDFYGKSKTEAEFKRDQYMVGIDAGLSVDYNKIKLGDFLHQWLFEVLHPSEMKPSTFDKYEGLYRNYVKNNPISQEIVANVKSITVQKYYNNLYKNGTTPKTIKNVHKLIRYFFNYCVAENYLAKNPCFKLTIPGTIEEKEVEEIDPYTDEEIAQFRPVLRGKDTEVLVLLCLGTGLREGELLGLRFQDIDIEQGMLNVKKHLKLVKIIKANGEYEYKRISQTPKTKSSRRTVPIPSSLIPLLKKHMSSEKEKLLKHGYAYSPDRLVFTTKSCNGIDNKNLLRSWLRTQKKAGVRYRNFHTLRHTYATKLFENGVPLKTVSTLLGHSNIKITADIYTHVIPKMKEKAVDLLNEYFL
ncbi:MAG: site-specific integrase [Firmicutes bacterium]|nr:site-specific integrase [Bacillota bacterium]